jgi:hypothetical protein
MQVKVFKSLSFTNNIFFNQFWCWLFGAMMRDRHRQARERAPSNKTSFIFSGVYSQEKAKLTPELRTPGATNPR